jgi:hypothetical protein
MSQGKLTAQEWETFLGLAERLEVDVRGVMNRNVRFTELESAGHRLGRAVAQKTTETLALLAAERITEPQDCPVCGRRSPVVNRQRELETIDGPIELTEPVCHCSACRRDFFPSASCLGARAAQP